MILIKRKIIIKIINKKIPFKVITSFALIKEGTIKCNVVPS
jgi:hypothetical protein